MFLKSWRWLIEWPCTFYAPWKLRFWDMTTCYEFTDIDTEIFCPILNFFLARFDRQGQTTSCKMEKSRMFYHLATMLVWWECWHIYYWRARLEQHLLHHAVLLSEILKCFLDRCLNSQSFSWTVDSRTSRNGQNWSKKEFSGDNARWIVMDIELLDNYILCEYFSIVEKRSYVLAHFLI